jgi:hypothetical protein
MDFKLAGLTAILLVGASGLAVGADTPVVESLCVMPDQAAEAPRRRPGRAMNYQSVTPPIWTATQSPLGWTPLILVRQCQIAGELLNCWGLLPIYGILMARITPSKAICLCGEKIGSIA